MTKMKNESTEELSMDELQEKLISSQKYFIKKFSEYVDHKQKPIFHKALQEKRYDSLILIFKECLDIQNDINEGNSDNSKLKASLKSSLKVISFHCESNPLSANGPLSRDLKYLIQQINKILKMQDGDDQDIKVRGICNSISSLTKKLNSEDIVNIYIDMILKKDFSYKDVDLLVQYIISELINQGYSLKYLQEWYETKLSQFNLHAELSSTELEKFLSDFKDLITDPIKYHIILNSWLPESLSEELQMQGYIDVGYRYFTLKEKEKLVIEERKTQLNYKESDNYHSLLVEIEAYDKYKAVEQASKSLENFLEMFKYLRDFNKKAINDSCLVSYHEDEWLKLRTDATDNFIFMRNIGNREKEDIKDFIDLRDEIRRKQTTNSSNIVLLNRSLEMIKNSFNTSPENRLLNIWSALEYTLTAYESKSIISKVLDIIPKVICLYTVKDKMNIIWERIYKFKSAKEYKEIEIVEEFFHFCLKKSEERTDKYDKDKLVAFFIDEDKLDALYESFENELIIHREIALIRELLNGKSTRKNIEDMHKVIEHDLTRIYRVRNKLTHSGNNISYNVDIFTVRLYKYINSLIGTLIHYVKREPDLNISEILHSIHETYEWYIEHLKKGDKKSKNIIAFPPYLYL